MDKDNKISFMYIFSTTLRLAVWFFLIWTFFGLFFKKYVYHIPFLIWLCYMIISFFYLYLFVFRPKKINNTIGVIYYILAILIAIISFLLFIVSGVAYVIFLFCMGDISCLIYLWMVLVVFIQSIDRLFILSDY